MNPQKWIPGKAWRIVSVFVVLCLTLSTFELVYAQSRSVQILIPDERTAQWDELLTRLRQKRFDVELMVRRETDITETVLTMIEAGETPSAAEISEELAETIAREMPDALLNLDRLSVAWPDQGIDPFKVDGIVVGFRTSENLVFVLFADRWFQYEIFDFLDIILPLFQRNPVLNSVVTAHGNVDWHVDTAHEFLFGVDIAGNASAANYCPDTWTKEHMHVGLSNTADFYFDDDLTSTGNDLDDNSGIDTAMLFFYAGHGNPFLWDTLGNTGTQSTMSLGDYEWLTPGLLRYYWQCSCEVFAHGPLTCANTTGDYACPGEWDGSADSATMRNVYERWGDVLEPDLRMACGVSTLAYCHEYQTNRIWNNYNNLNLDVADSFIDGLKGSPWPVPLCITRGGLNVNSSPLVTDTRFTNERNSAGTTHYHIQYLESFASNPPFLWIEIPLPEERVPIWQLWPPPLPDPLRDIEFELDGDFLMSPEQVNDRGFRVRVNRLSGAIYMLGELQPVNEGKALEEQEYIEHAQRFIEEQGWIEENVTEPVGERFIIEVTPIEDDRNSPQRFQKNVTVTFRRQIKIGGIVTNLLGEGGEMRVQLNNDGSILNASKVWRELGDVVELAPVKTFDQAYGDALRQIENPEEYQLDKWVWGYKEEAGNVEQTELRIVFQFWFVPLNTELTHEFPPQMIEVPGHPE